MSVVLSKLLKKSFEIIADVESNGVKRDDLEEIMSILRDHKKDKSTKTNYSTDPRVSSKERTALLRESFKKQQGSSRNQSHRHDYASLRTFADPFEEVVQKVKKESKLSSKEKRIQQSPRPMQKSHEKFDAHEVDYGEQQKQLQKARNAKMVKAMIFLGILSLFIGMIAIRVSS